MNWNSIEEMINDCEVIINEEHSIVVYGNEVIYMTTDKFTEREVYEEAYKNYLSLGKFLEL